MKTQILLSWLLGKLSDAEQSLRSREALAESFELRTSPEFWDELSKAPGVIATKAYRGRKGPTVEQNRESAAAQRRIAGRCRNDVAMLKATIDAVQALSPES